MSDLEDDAPPNGGPAIDRVEAMRERILMLEDRTRALKAKLSQERQARLAKTADRNGGADASQQAAKQYYEKYRGIRERYRAAIDAKARLQRTVKQLKAATKRETERLKKVKTVLSAKVERNVLLEARVVDQQAAIANLREKLDAEHDALLRLKKTVEDRNRTTESLKERLKEERSRYNMERTRFNEERLRFNEERERFKEDHRRIREDRQRFKESTLHTDAERAKFKEEYLRFQKAISQTNEERARFKEEHLRFNKVISQTNEERTRFKEEHLRFNEERTRLLDRITDLRNKSLNQRESIATARKRIDSIRENSKSISILNPLQRIMQFNKSAAEIIPATADCIVTHGMQPLPLISALGPGRFRRTINDCIEIPSFSDRVASKRRDTAVTDCVDRYLASYLKETDVVATVSSALTARLHEMGCKSVHVLPNYRDYAEPPAPQDLRQRLSIPDDALLLLSVGLVSSCMIEFLQGLKTADVAAHFICVDTIFPASYRNEVHAAVAELDLSDRVHFIDPEPYEHLPALSAAADAGVFVCDPRIGNNSVSLPNRVFDFFSGGTPLIAPNVPDIAAIIARFAAGETVRDISAAGWADAIGRAKTESRRWRAGAIAANGELTWASNKPVLDRIFDDMRHVVFVGVGDLTRNNRTFRIARDLRAEGREVAVIGSGDAERARFASEGVEVLTVG